MTQRIRDDLVGRVIAHDGGNPVWLAAGDEVPKGVQVADALLQSEVTTAAPTTAKRGGRRASSKQ